MSYSKHIPTLEEFQAASKRLKNVAMQTPLIPLRWYDENPNILLKPEIFQPIGSYKIRGVYNWAMQLDPEERAKGISTVSAGNMAIAVAYVGKMLGIPATQRFFKILLPQIMPGIVAGSSLTVLISFSQYIITLLIGGGTIKTLPIVMFPYISSGERSVGAVYSLIFAIVSITVLFAMDRYLKTYYTEKYEN